MGALQVEQITAMIRRYGGNKEKRIFAGAAAVRENKLSSASGLVAWLRSVLAIRSSTNALLHER
jgi:hypothetical protein